MRIENWDFRVNYSNLMLEHIIDKLIHISIRSIYMYFKAVPLYHSHSGHTLSFLQIFRILCLFFFTFFLFSGKKKMFEIEIKHVQRAYSLTEEEKKRSELSWESKCRPLLCLPFHQAIYSWIFFIHFISFRHFFRFFLLLTFFSF